jgi:hypothetical protein
MIPICARFAIKSLDRKLEEARMKTSRLLISLLGAAALMAACASHYHHHMATTSALITVRSDATTNSETTRIQARNGAEPSKLQWNAADASATLSIDFDDPAQKCVRGLRCSGATCNAVSNVDFHESTPAQCHYRTSLNGGAVTHDPIIIIDNCCP